MTRFEFMYRLEQELQDISLEEREEALKYYEEYIADAGTLSDDQLVKEFGTPEKVAAMIKADLSNKEKEMSEPKEDSKIYTERGFEDTTYSDLKFEVTGETEKNENKSYKEDENEQNFGSAFEGEAYHSSGSYYDYSSQTDTSENHDERKHSKLWSNKWFWILLCIFFLPTVVRIVFGLFTGVFGAVAGIFFTVVVMILALMFCSGACLLSGALITIFGIVGMFRFPIMEGLLYSGIGILIFGIGMLLLPMTSWLFKEGLPSLFSIIKRFFGRLLSRRRRTL